MGIFDRLSTLLRSNINDLISSAENPEKMLNQILVDMRSQLAKAKQQVAAAIADEKRLRDQADAERRQSEDWEKRAMLAVQEGRDDLAKQALVRQGEHSQHAEQLEVTWQAHQAETEKLKASLRELNDKIEEAKRKKTLLVARQKRAEAHSKIQETLGGLKNASAFEAFDQMAQKVDQMEAQAEATNELAREYSGDSLAQRFGELESTAGADEQLLALKRKMGVLPPEPSPAPVRVDESAPLDAREEAELTQALAELEAEEQRSLQAKR